MPASLRHAEESLREALGPEAMPLVAFAGTVEEAVRTALGEASPTDRAAAVRVLEKIVKALEG